MSKQSEGNRRRWARVPKEERTKIMSRVALAKHQSLTLEQRQAHSAIMSKAKAQKQNGKIKEDNPA